MYGKSEVCGVIAELFVNHVFIAHATEVCDLRLLFLELLLKLHQFGEIVTNYLGMLRLFLSRLHSINDLTEVLFVFIGKDVLSDPIKNAINCLIGQAFYIFEIDILIPLLDDVTKVSKSEVV